MSQVLFVGVAQLLVLLGANGQGAPPGLPPLAEDPVLAAAAPPQCLAYLTWSGLPLRRTRRAPIGRSNCWRNLPYRN